VEVVDTNAMTDLVERLRDDSGEPDIRLFRLRMRDAADEIERLRRELSYHAHTDEDIKVQNAEIERLEKICHAQSGEVINRLHDEIERLRAALQRIANDSKNCADHCVYQARRALGARL
jgi:DNA repair exonuclease SbcCD ATPase subunit